MKGLMNRSKIVEEIHAVNTLCSRRFHFGALGE